MLNLAQRTTVSSHMIAVVNAIRPAKYDVHQSGVNHAGQEGRAPPSPEFGVGDANANCPLDLEKLRHKIYQNTGHLKINFIFSELTRVRVRYLLLPVCLSVCNARAPYVGG